MGNTYEKFNVHIGGRIKSLRLERKFSRDYLARCAEISPKFLYEIEHGRKGCSFYVIYKLARSLEADINYFIQEEVVSPVKLPDLYMHFDEKGKKNLDEIIEALYKIIYDFR